MQKEILARIALHYPEAEREAVWEKVQRQYVEFLSDWRTDLGGKKNFHNGAGGTYDCIAILSYYAACRTVTSFREIEEMEENLILPSRDEKSRTFSSNSKRSHILRTSSRSRRLILSSIVSLAVSLKWTRTI